MWVLVPLTGAPAAAAASGGEAAAQQPQPQHSNDRTHFLTCAGRDISVGRPLKKGSSVGKADILVFNEQSVSTVHAHLKADLPGSTGDVPTHGALTITGAGWRFAARSTGAVMNRNSTRRRHHRCTAATLAAVGTPSPHWPLCRSPV
jgi:hypothetical protein